MTADRQELFFQRLNEQNKQYKYHLPSRQEAGKFIQNLLNFLFPLSQDCPSCPSKDLASKFSDLRNDLSHMIEPLSAQLNKPDHEVLEEVFTKIPDTYEMLLMDAKAMTDYDPASVSMEEVISIYPGFMAIATYRFANLFAKSGIPLLPRMLTEFAHSQTGIDIHPNATIGHSFFIDHGTGVVIGETAEIGNNVVLYQGVTLGATHVSKSLASRKRHPTIEDNVVVYANATILGGQTVIGHDSIIGGSAWLTKSVPPFSMVYHQNKIEIRQQSTSLT